VQHARGILRRLRLAARERARARQKRERDRDEGGASSEVHECSRRLTTARICLDARSRVRGRSPALMASNSDGDSRQRAEARVGRVLRGKLRLDGLIGVGGTAAVYSATHRTGRRFAVKMIHRELMLEATTRARFFREGYVVNKVEHPGVVTVLDDDVDDD